METQTSGVGGRGRDRSISAEPLPTPPSNEPKDEGKSSVKILKVLFVTLPLVLLIKWIWPDFIPFGVFDFWLWDRDSIVGGIEASSPIFIWAFVVTLIFTSFQTLPGKPVYCLVRGLLTSVFAGIVEELIFRWVLFFSAIIAVQVINFLFFGFLNSLFGWYWAELPRLIFWYVVLPVADFMSLHNFSGFLIGQGWIVGAAVISANAKFRDGHGYLGWFGLINSWYIGLFLFWIMFNYGLVAAIIVHFLYDAIIDWVVFLHAIVRK